MVALWQKRIRYMGAKPRICEECRGTYIPKNHAGERLWAKQRFCSRECTANYWKGKNRPGCFQKGMTQPREEKSSNWKGDAVKYSALHYWVRRVLGTPVFCAMCGRTDRKRYEWANISQDYKRDVSDWMRVCKSCHTAYDDTVNKSWKVRKLQYQNL